MVIEKMENLGLQFRMRNYLYSLGIVVTALQEDPLLFGCNPAILSPHVNWKALFIDETIY